MATQDPTTMRELDSRTTDGISVQLLWNEPDGRLFVSVADCRTASSFSMEVHDRERTREVFNHPYAYAAWYGVDTGAKSATGAAVSSSLTS